MGPTSRTEFDSKHMNDFQSVLAQSNWIHKLGSWTTGSKQYQFPMCCQSAEYWLASD